MPVQLEVVRDDLGHFLPGVENDKVPNAAKKLRAYIQNKLETGGANMAVEALIEAMVSGNTLERIAAAKLLLEFGYGKPRIQAEITGEDGGPIEIARARDDLDRAVASIAARIAAARNTADD